MTRRLLASLAVGGALFALLPAGQASAWCPVRCPLIPLSDVCRLARNCEVPPVQCVRTPDVTICP